MLADGEYGLPAGDRVGADDRVDGLEQLADVLGGAASLAEELEAVALSGFVEAWLRVCGSQGLEEALVWLRDAVV